MARIQVGTAAPDLRLYGEAEDLVRLSDYWREAPVVALFLRHFG